MSERWCQYYEDEWRREDGSARLTQDEVVDYLNALEAGIPIEQLRVLMGHKNLASTARYAEHTIQLQAFESMKKLAGKLVAE